MGSIRRFLIAVAVLLSILVRGQTQLFLNDYPLTGAYTPVSRDSAKRLFDYVKTSPILDYRYTRGGCDYRAHAVYLLLKRRGVETFKLWNFASAKIFIGGKDFNTHNLLLLVKDRLHLSTEDAAYRNCPIKLTDNVYWGYHVAPVILVADGPKVDTLVIDPALFNSLVDYKEWIKAPLQEKASSYYVFLKGNLISFQTESQYQVQGKCCQDCSGNNIITGVFFDDAYSIANKLIEESISKGRIFVEYYLHEILPKEQQLLNGQVNQASGSPSPSACEIAWMKNIISTENDLKQLPDSYQLRYQTYMQEATKALFP